MGKHGGGRIVPWGASGTQEITRTIDQSLSRTMLKQCVFV